VQKAKIHAATKPRDSESPLDRSVEADKVSDEVRDGRLLLSCGFGFPTMRCHSLPSERRRRTERRKRKSLVGGSDNIRHQSSTKVYTNRGRKESE
jgi:hypothetical protein